MPSQQLVPQILRPAARLYSEERRLPFIRPDAAVDICDMEEWLMIGFDS
jgi:hypothetical protein